MIITIQDLDRWGACCREPGEKYSDKNILAWLHGWEGFESSAIPDLPIRKKDKVWLGCQDGVLLPEQREQWINEIIKRAIRRQLGLSGVPEWEMWAQKWLSGEDQTDNSANIASVAASGVVYSDPTYETRAIAAAHAAVTATLKAYSATSSAAITAVWSFNDNNAEYQERMKQVEDLRNFLNTELSL